MHAYVQLHMNKFIAGIAIKKQNCTYVYNYTSMCNCASTSKKCTYIFLVHKITCTCESTYKLHTYMQLRTYV